MWLSYVYALVTIGAIGPFALVPILAGWSW